MKRIRLILVSPKYAGNVGSCARAAANFGVTDFCVVAPQCDVRDSVAFRMATGRSREVLDAARVFPTLDAALADCHTAVAIARRIGDLSPTEGDFATLPEWIAGFAPETKIALVFGREDNCLTVEEMFLCARQIPIPTSEFMPTMNLSHAVAVVLAQIHLTQNTLDKTRVEQKQPATLVEFEGLIDHWRDVMSDADIYKTGAPERALLRLRRSLQKADFSVKEISIVRALLSKIQVALGTRKRHGNNSSATSVVPSIAATSKTN